MLDTQSYYKHCAQCPRSCGVDRTAGQKGFCGEDNRLRAAVACLHFGEEPFVTVFGGSGTIFLTGCTLACAFCQNYQISQKGYGKEVSKDGFVRICLALQKAGAENINLVTPSHQIPLLAEYLAAARDCGLAIPICWNSSGYESVESLELLRGLVDIWLPDIKTLNAALSKKLFNAPDYPEAAKAALLWMTEASPLKIVEAKKDGEVREKIMSGVIARHLFLPGRFEESADVLDWLKKNLDGRAVISLMSQYTPVPFKEDAEALQKRLGSLDAIQNRLVSRQEDADLQDLIEAYDFETLFYQELSDDTSWLPDFTRPEPFGNKLAKVLWHC
ncbi:MAG: radical SAM protein [Treponema sp.]|nr:radical SAM protein [Treponema sp.]